MLPIFNIINIPSLETIILNDCVSFEIASVNSFNLGTMTYTDVQSLLNMAFTQNDLAASADSMFNTLQPTEFQELDAKYYYLVKNGILNNFTTVACCIYPTAKIETPFGLVQIKDIRAGDKVKDINGKFINVIYNIKFVPTSDFICIKKDTFGTNLPFEDLRATGGHPLLKDGKEVTFENLINNCTIIKEKLESEFVYALCTEERTFVMTNGIPVCTWSQYDWETTYAKTQSWLKL